MKKQKPKKNSGVRKTYYLSARVAKWIDTEAARENRTASNFLTTLLLKKVS
jgi:hypothetical protein